MSVRGAKRPRGTNSTVAPTASPQARPAKQPSALRFARSIDVRPQSCLLTDIHHTLKDILLVYPQSTNIRASGGRSNFSAPSFDVLLASHRHGQPAQSASAPPLKLQRGYTRETPNLLPFEGGLSWASIHSTPLPLNCFSLGRGFRTIATLDRIPRSVRLSPDSC